VIGKSDNVLKFLHFNRHETILVYVFILVKTVKFQEVGSFLLTHLHPRFYISLYLDVTISVL